MNLSINCVFADRNDQYKTFNVEKTYENVSIIPQIGMKVFEGLFGGETEKKVVDMFLDYEENTCIVYLEPVNDLILDEVGKQWRESARLHNWKVYG
jgi:hypothetical protein